MPYPVKENLRSYNNPLVLSSNASIKINKTVIFKNNWINESLGNDTRRTSSNEQLLDWTDD